MTPREKIHAAIDDIAQPHGYTVEDILGPSRLKHLVSVRRDCVLMLRGRGYSTPEIGRLMNRCHTTIVHALNKTVDRCNDMVVGTDTNNERDVT
jgi:chromosomal replication initiation ATPase DnaA